MQTKAEATASEALVKTRLPASSIKHNVQRIHASCMIERRRCKVCSSLLRNLPEASPPRSCRF